MMRIIKGGVPSGKVLKEIMSAEPKPYNELITWWVLQGPLIHSAKPLEPIFDRQIESDAKLSKELENILRRKRLGECTSNFSF